MLSKVMAGREMGQAWRVCRAAGRVDGSTWHAEQLEPREMLAVAPIGPKGPSLTAPSALAAVIVSPTSVGLTWSDADKAVTGYYVMRSVDGTNWDLLTKITDKAKRAYTDSQAKANTRYFYGVEAYNSASISAPSGSVSLVTPLVAPGSVAASLVGGHVHVTWKSGDAATGGYELWRAVDGGSFSLVSNLDGIGSVSYDDSSVGAGYVYSYKIKAVGASNSSLYSSAVKVGMPLSAPSSLSAGATATSVTLTWGGLDAHAKSYIVMRSTDNKNFSTVATLASNATGFVDLKVATGTAYYYKVSATNPANPSGTSAVQATTTLLAPRSLAASVSGMGVDLTWSDPNRTGMGYVVLRSTDGVNFSALATLAPGSAAKYRDSAVGAKQAYVYEVRAVAGAQVSPDSNSAGATTPNGTSNVLITSRYGSELVVTSTGGADHVSISESGSLLTININGQDFHENALPAGLFVYDRAGGDTITIDASVAVRTTLSMIGAGVSTIVSSCANVSAWIDSADIISGAGLVHRVSAFAGGVSMALGASLANPKDAGTTKKITKSLFGAAPEAGDVNQGGVGDCYFLSSLAAFAEEDDSVLLQSAVDLGDGTYAVEYKKAGKPVYVRVSNAMPVDAYGRLRFARPGVNDTMWALVMEKAFAYFRTGANTYASISGGWMSEVYSILGVSSSNFWLNTGESAFFDLMQARLNQFKAVTLATSTRPSMLVGNHAYTLVNVWKDDSGATHYVVRNPWGVSGTRAENSGGYATLTFAQMQANFVCGTFAA